MYQQVKKPYKQILIWILRLSAFCVFFGRGWEHLYTDAPFRAVLWDPSIMESLITFLTGLSWHQYTSSSTCNFIIDMAIKLTGIFYMLCAVVALVVQPKQKHLSKMLIYGSCLLIVLSFLFYKTKFNKFGQFIEYSCQMFSPLFLYAILLYEVHLKKFNFFLKTAIALTFIGHGLYALGIYITPGVWFDMAMGSANFLGLQPLVAQIETTIFIAGVLDVVVAICIFLPKKLAIPFLLWAFIWGLFTALSRIVGFMYFDPTWHTFLQWLPQTILRLPHALIPVAALLITWHYK